MQNYATGSKTDFLHNLQDYAINHAKTKFKSKRKMFKYLSTKGKYIHNVKCNSIHSVVKNDEEEPYKLFAHTDVF